MLNNRNAPRVAARKHSWDSFWNRFAVNVIALACAYSIIHITQVDYQLLPKLFHAMAELAKAIRGSKGALS